MAIFTAWAKIYSTKINISVCKGTCRWVGRTFCPTKISSCTAFLKHTFAYQSAPHTLSYFFHTFIRHVGHRDVLNAVLGPCRSVRVVDLGRLSPTTLTLQDHSGGIKEKGWMIICYAEVTDLTLLTFGECECECVCVCVFVEMTYCLISCAFFGSSLCYKWQKEYYKDECLYSLDYGSTRACRQAGKLSRRSVGIHIITVEPLNNYIGGNNESSCLFSKWFIKKLSSYRGSQCIETMYVSAMYIHP